MRGFVDALIEYPVQPRFGAPELDIYLALYDRLVDDDEDIRDQGAKTVSTLLSTTDNDPFSEDRKSLSLSPPAAKRRLLDHLVKSYRSLTYIFTRAAERLTGVKSRSQTISYKWNDEPIATGKIGFLSVAELSTEARKPQTAVFAEEKQNLYIDDVEEAEAWAGALIQVDNSAWDDEIARALERWTTEGINHFLELFQDQADGPLGLSSEPEIFTLIMRVILAAKVLIVRWEPQELEEDASKGTMRSLLMQLYELGRKVDLHSLLLNTIGEVLRRK